METKVKENHKENGAAKKEDKAAFVNANPVNKDSVKALPEAGEKGTDVKAGEQKPAAQKPEAPKPEAPKPEPPKAEQAQTEAGQVAKKAALNLEASLKFIEEMHRKAKQRAKLQETIKNLDDFNVELRDEADSTDTNFYNGCVLTIEDDQRRKFETKNPTIIWTVAQMVNNMCVEKLAEIEAGIVIPQ